LAKRPGADEREDSRRLKNQTFIGRRTCKRLIFCQYGPDHSALAPP
jgi:hypothetical protein